MVVPTETYHTVGQYISWYVSIGTRYIMVAPTVCICFYRYIMVVPTVWYVSIGTIYIMWCICFYSGTTSVVYHGCSHSVVCFYSNKIYHGCSHSVVCFYSNTVVEQPYMFL